MDLLTLISLILSILGIGITIFIALITTNYKKPLYVHSFENIFNVKTLCRDKLIVNYNNSRIDTLSKSVIILWNEGRQSIRKHDLLEDRPLSIKISNGLILEYKVLSTIGMNKTLCLTLDNNSIYIDFDSMQKNDGFIVEILHTAIQNKDVFIDGKIDNCKNIKNKKNIQFQIAMIVNAVSFVLTLGIHLLSLNGMKQGGLWGLGIAHGNGIFLDRYASEMGIIGVIFLQLIVIAITYKLFNLFNKLYPKQIQDLVESRNTHETTI